jgi:hypothetical protein
LDIHWGWLNVDICKLPQPQSPTFNSILHLQPFSGNE